MMVTTAPSQKRRKPGPNSVDPPPDRPRRAPVHELALVVRDGRATIGIAHAGEMLAGVRLTAAETWATAERLLIGLALAEGAEAVAEQACAALGVRRLRPPEPVRRAGWRERRATCRGCGAGFAVRAPGKLPNWCRDCRRSRNADRMAIARAREAVRG